MLWVAIGLTVANAIWVAYLWNYSAVLFRTRDEKIALTFSFLGFALGVWMLYFMLS